MRIGFDLDDVLFDFSNELHAYHNRQYGTNYERKDFIQELESMWGCTEEESVRRVFDFFRSPDHWDVMPISGAVEGIKNLKKHHSLFVVTSKPEELKERSMQWLDKYFPQMFDEVHFTNQYYGNGNKRRKSEVCKELGIEIFVEDFITNANDVAEVGIPVLLFDSPWNQAKVEPPITRVHSWDEIVNILSKNE